MTIFQESDGAWSMRRVLACVFCVLACVAGFWATFAGVDWKLAAVAFGVPIGAVLVLTFFTTWEAVAGIVRAVKGDK